jgi:hypothetical protein
VSLYEEHPGTERARFHNLLVERLEVGGGQMNGWMAWWTDNCALLEL